MLTRKLLAGKLHKTTSPSRRALASLGLTHCKHLSKLATAMATTFRNGTTLHWHRDHVRLAGRRSREAAL